MSTAVADVAPAEVNPFDPASFATGGGLWDGKIVTITSSVTKTEALTYKDGSPVIDAKTKTQSLQTGLFIKGIAEGGDDKERSETYGVGDKLAPTPDGEGFVSKDGGPLKFHANSGVAKLAAALKASGFDLSTLLEGGKQKLGRLVGARFVMRAEAKLGKDGKPLLDKNGYPKQSFYPARFVGYAAGSGTSVSAALPPGVVVPAAAGALATKAAGAVLTALAAGPLTRADLVRALATQLAGDADANAIIGLVVRDDFHTGQAWSYDGVTAKL